MKKVLHLITGLERGGGAENMLLQVLSKLTKTSNAVCALRGRGEIGAELEALGVKVYYLEMKGLWDWGVVKRYQKVLEEFKPDAQINYLIHADIFGRIWGRKFRIKTIVSSIRNRHVKPLFVWLDRLTLGKTDFLLANSQAVLSHYRTAYKYSAASSGCIPNGVAEVAVVNIDFSDLEKEFGFNKKENFVITCVARLHPQKDQPTLFRAMKILKGQGVNNLRLLLCGRGKELKKLILLARTLGLEKEIHFLGVRKDVARIMEMADVLVLPSRHEGMSNALLEAMARSRACVVSDIPENRELIDNGLSGLTFSLGDANDLAGKLELIRKNEKLRGELGEAAKAKIKKDYSIAGVVSAFDDFILKMAEMKRKIIWVTNTRNNIYQEIIGAVAEARPDWEMIMVAGDKEKEDLVDNGRFKLKTLYSVVNRRSFLYKVLKFVINIFKPSADVPMISWLKGLGAYLRSERPHLVLANLYYEPSSWQVAWSCFCLRRPFVLTEEKKIIGGHVMARFFGSIFFFLAWPIFYASKMVWAWTEPTADFLRRHVKFLNHKKIAVFPASINPKLFNSQGIVRADDGVLKIVMVARFVVFKRHKDLFAALKYIKASAGPKFSLSLVGRGGEQEEEIKRLAIEAGLENEIHFMPVVPNEEMKAFYAAHDIFVLPSYNEAIGIVVPEAMACALPVVVSDTCGGRTFVEDGVSGFIFKTFDYFDLAEKIVKLSDVARRQSMGERAAESVAKNYTNQAAAERFIQLAEKLF